MLFSRLRQLNYDLQKKILTILGDVKWHKYPCWIIYDPQGYKLKGKDFDVVSQKVKKYDVLLNRFNDYLDTGFIPGFWNHAAVNVGHNADVNPAIVHAISDGVVQETLVDLMRTDHIVILRPKFKVNPELFEERLKEALKKGYDFNFNSSNTNRLFCSELIDFLFKDMFPGFKKSTVFLGKEAILPQDIYESQYFEIVFERRTS